MTARALNSLACLFVAAGLGASPVFGEGATDGIPAFTKPSGDVVLSFARPGRVVEIVVKEGDQVEKGQQLARQDDSEESKVVELYKSKAEDATQVDAQKMIEKQSATDAQHLEQINVSSTYEIEHARLQEKVDAAKIEIAKRQQEQDGYQYEQNLAIEEKTKLFSPIKGVVEELLVHPGESVDNQNMKVMRIVSIDPMWVEAQVPYNQAQALKNGDTAQIHLSNKTTLNGHVIHVAAVAETASDTLLVRVEAGNPDGRKLGERVTVSFNGAKVASAGQP
jgi:RND family efflux transporter MFP subunit